MNINYNTVDLEKKDITLEKVVSIEINGIKITQIKNGLRLSTDLGMVVFPNASNSVTICKQN